MAIAAFPNTLCRTPIKIFNKTLLTISELIIQKNMLSSA